MKIKVLVFYISFLFICDLHSQTVKNYRQVFFFNEKSSGQRLNICDENNNLFYVADPSGLISWFENKGYCPLSAYAYDTVKTDTEIIVKTKMMLEYPKPDRVFKITKAANAIYIDTMNVVSGSLKRIKYCTMDKAGTNILQSLFSSDKDSSMLYEIRMLKTDTVIRFQDIVFHAYKIREQAADASGEYSNFIYIDKKSLLPVYKETHIRRNQVFLDGGSRKSVRKYFLRGILHE